MANNLPDIYAGVAFNAEPFDPYGVPVYVDLSSRYTGTGSAARGQDQYELDQAQTGTADVTFYDQDEALNPANPSSPYWPNVVPYRAFLWRVMYPAGGTGNILAGAGYDGSFESYAAGLPVPPFFIMVNLSGVLPAAVVPSIVGAGAWQGTRALQMAVSGAATTKPAGVFIGLQLIPGRQYTAQVHVNQTAAVPFQLAVASQTLSVDAFNRTIAANGGWGGPSTALEFGASWFSSPSNTGMSVIPGSALMSQAAVNSRMSMFLNDGVANHAVQDCDQWVTVTIPVVATGAAIQVSLFARVATDNLACLISFNTDASVTLTAQKFSGGVTSNIGSPVTLPTPYAAGDKYRVHAKMIGPDIWLKAWKTTTVVPEPAAWLVQGSDNSVTVPGIIGVSTILTAGNTNTLPVLFTFSDYRAVGSIVDTSTGQTSVSGSYQQINITFTATQSSQQIQMKMQTAPTGANTILVDGLQVEPGATANAFTAAGPIVRSPWTRGYIERWPFVWDGDSNGFLGIMSGPVVGPFFQLSNAILHAEYRGAVMAKNPRYYWTLSESAAATTAFGDQSGNSGTSLYRYDATEGPATAFAPGTSVGIVGDPGGVGVSITGTGVVGGPYNASILLAGDAGFGQQLVGLGGTGLAWSLTAAFWLNSPSPSSATLLGGLHLLLASDLPAASATRFTLGIETVYTGGNQGVDMFFGNFGAGITTPKPATTFDGLDGKPHLYIGVLTFVSNTLRLDVYYDGALYGTNTVASVSATFGTAALNSPMLYPSVAGSRTTPGSSNSVNMGIIGTYTHLALWDRALSSAEIADLYQAGIGYPNENSGTRVARYVSLAQFPGVTDIGQGMTTMGPSVLAENTDALSAILDGPTATEFGKFYESQDGIAFRGRQARYLAVAAAYVFGENVAGGEWPYEGDIAYDDDATYVWNTALITRTGGAVLAATDTTGRSQMRYGPKTFTRTVGGNNDLEAQDAATYVVANSKDARPRLAALTFNPAAVRGVTASPNGTLWPMLLTLELGTRVTVKRRPKAANGGAGLTISGDFFVEAITPNQVDTEAGTYKVTLLLSPVPVTAQPWILDDTTYSVLDSTTVLGF